MSTANQFRQTAKGLETRPCYEFGAFVLDTIQHALLKQGTPVPLTPKTYDTLLILVQNNGRMLSKEELMQALWPDSFVEESNLTQQVSMIRKALGESASEPRYIVTVPGCGYRFTAQPNVAADDEPSHRRVSGIPVLEFASDAKGLAAAPARLDLNGASVPAISVSDAPLPFRVPRTLLVVAISAVLLVVVAVIVVARFPSALRSKLLQTVTPRSLAILPLQNIRQDAASDFLGFSLADAVITKLDYVSSLTVRPSTAVEKYRDKVIDIQLAAADLKVDTLVTGSFIRDGNNLRITYQLVDVKTDKILGAGAIDLKYDNLLSVHDNVAEQIVAKLELNLSPAEAERIKPEAPINPLAYEFYLRGVDLYGQHKF